MIRHRFSKDIFKRDVLPWFFLVPAILSFALFKYYPILLGFFVSFFEVNIVDLPGTFIGFDNYIRAFQDKDFLNAIVNTFQFLVISLLINFWVPILLATLINEVRRGKTFVRTMYFIPAEAPGIAMSVLWKYIWQPDYGLLGCSRADGERVLLLPRDCNEFCARLQSLIHAQAGDTVQVLVFGSADGHEPTLANGLPPGLGGAPLGARLRYMADHLFSGRAEDSTADETRYLDRRKAQWQKIHDRPAGDVTLAGQLGQLCYNVSISADGTPAVLVQGFFNSQQP